MCDKKPSEILKTTKSKRDQVLNRKDIAERLISAKNSARIRSETRKSNSRKTNITPSRRSKITLLNMSSNQDSPQFFSDVQTLVQAAKIKNISFNVLKDMMEREVLNITNMDKFEAIEKVQSLWNIRPRSTTLPKRRSTENITAPSKERRTSPNRNEQQQDQISADYNPDNMELGVDKGIEDQDENDGESEYSEAIERALLEQSNKRVRRAYGMSVSDDVTEAAGSGTGF